MSTQSSGTPSPGELAASEFRVKTLSISVEVAVMLMLHPYRKTNGQMFVRDIVGLPIDVHFVKMELDFYTNNLVITLAHKSFESVNLPAGQVIPAVDPTPTVMEIEVFLEAQRSRPVKFREFF